MSVDNHKHCQATVLGATGSGRGNGVTWNTINGLNLPCLDSIEQNWKSSFLRNRNITDDLADILRLINKVAGQIQEPTSVEGGDLIRVVNNAVSIKNSIPDNYTGPIGISGSGQNRQLVQQEAQQIPSFNVVDHGDSDGDLLAEITYGDQTFSIHAKKSQGDHDNNINIIYDSNDDDINIIYDSNDDEAIDVTYDNNEN